jgi:Glycosyl transferase family 2
LIKDYFYRLLNNYFAASIRPGDRALYVDPRPGLLSQAALTSEVWVLLTRPCNPRSGWKLLTFEEAQQHSWDYIVLNGNLHYEEDIILFLRQIYAISKVHTRLLVTHYSAVWKPALRLAELLGFREITSSINWITHEDMANFARLSGFDIVSRSLRILLPLRLPLAGDWINRWLAQCPGVRLLDMVNLVVLRPVPGSLPTARPRPSVSVVIPARNEAGNIEAAFQRLPIMGPHDEIIFVEGNSTDKTWSEIERCAAKYRETDTRSIKILKQDGKGKKDAVYKGFAAAENEVLMILDADLTVPPEDLPKFYAALIEGHGEFVNGSRLVYEMQDQAMRFLNMIANKFFAWAFSLVLGQGLRDTLCGTKVFTRNIYKRIDAHRDYFGDFDPYGDFDLIFGAARLNLKFVEVPVRYHARTYGSTNINRFRDGLVLLRMLWFGARKLKFL